MAKAEPLPFDQSDPWKPGGYRPQFNHVPIPSSLIRRDDVDWAVRRDEDGDTLLHIAVAKGNEVACRKLVGILKSRNRPLDMRNNIMQTPLHVACITDNPTLTALLLNANPASCDVTDRHGNNSVHLAIKHSSSATQYVTLRTVINTASSAALEKKNIYGLAPMHLAALEGNHKGIHLLKRAGVDINLLENKGGASPIILAARASQREAAQALLELGANPNIRTTYGESASQLASAKGDHAMSELLALYDSSYDVTKHSTIPRYLNESFVSPNKEVSKQLPRHSDVKLKPFVNNHHLSVPPTSSIHIAKVSPTSTVFTSPPRNENVYVKSERRSPAAPYPRSRRLSSDKRKQVPATSSDISNQPLNFAMRKPSNNRECRTMTQQSNPHEQPKRKHVEDEPLDLSFKKPKKAKDPEQAPDERSAATTNGQYVAEDRTPRSNYVFVHPLYPHSPVRIPPQYYYYNTAKIMPHPYTVANQMPPTATAPITRPANEVRASYLPMTKRLVETRDFPQSSKRHSHEVHYQDQPIKQHHNEIRHRDYLINRQYDAARHPEQAVATNPDEHRHNYKPIAKHLNGVHTSFQQVSKRLQDPPQLILSHVDLPQPIPTRSHDTREPFQPITKKSKEPRDPPRLINGRSDEPRYQQGSTSSSIAKPTTSGKLSTNQSPHATSSRERQNSINRERRYQSDDRCHGNGVNRPMGKQSIVRRNSAPVTAKSGGDKLELRSYTGCLPPHFLHLLESSGNLPIRTSNALRNVADVLRNEIQKSDVRIKQEPPDKGSDAIKGSDVGKSTPSFSDEATNRSTTSINTPLTSVIASEDVAPGVAVTFTTQTRRFNFDKLGDWTGIESGNYPAFGTCHKAKQDHPMRYSHKNLESQEFRLDKTYITDETKNILQKATDSSAAVKSPLRLRHVAAVGNGHACLGCTSDRKGTIPKLIGDFWKFTPMRKYVTASSNPSSNVVYCCQMTNKKSPITSSNKGTLRCASSEICEPATSIIEKQEKQPSKLPLSRNNSLDAKLEQLRKRALTRPNDDSAFHDNKANEAENDDILANSIEDSSDEDTPNEPIKTHHEKTRNGLKTTNGQIHSMAKNGFHGNLSGVIQKTILKNLELHSELMRKLRDVQDISSRKMRCSTTEEMHISDLEISDDEDGSHHRKIR